MKSFKTFNLSYVLFLIFTNCASAETTMSAEGQYIFNSLGFYIGGVLVALWLLVFVCLKVVWLLQKVYQQLQLRILVSLQYVH